ncbi:MAG: tandem-95 repeat protein [Caldilinea sp. CFX5]|nr:tandem-95 repeat protein [Caldilinea sp. CFX5]
MKQVLSTFVMVSEFLASQECRVWLRLALKPLAVLATLAVFLWLGAWFDTQIANHVAHAQIQQFVCPAGLEESGRRCYPPCEEGLTGIGPTCFKACPSGYQAAGDLCRARPSVIFKKQSARESGPPPTCAPNQEAQGGLCYPKCAVTHVGSGPLCMQRCPSSYSDMGSFCRQSFPFDLIAKNIYVRGAGAPPSSCPVGMERVGTACFQPCPAGLDSLGTSCSTRCPAGFNDAGRHCTKIDPVLPREGTSRGDGEPANGIPIALDRLVVTDPNGFSRLVYQIQDDSDVTNYPIIIVEGPQHGVLEENNTIYRPTFDFFVPGDQIRWKTTDGKHESNVGLISIVFMPVPASQPPLALDRTVVVTEETSIAIEVLCTDPENDELFYQLLDRPQHGDYEWQPPNTVIYTPTVDFVGTDSFTFRSHDGQNFSNVSTITLTVVGVNDAPAPVPQSISTTRNNNVAVTLAATDAENDPITYTVVSGPAHGTLSGELPDLLYTPQPNFVGDDSFQFQAVDSQGAAAVATVNITVLPGNTPPVAAALTLTTSQESALAVTLAATDAEGDALTYNVVAGPTNGVLSGAGADLIYTPNAGFIGTDSFTYTSSDGQAASPATTVTIHVLPAPDAASVVGIVFADQNGNGQPDGDESGVSGLLVTLTPVDARAGSSFTATTDAVGAWQIDGVGFGQYTLKVTAGSGVPIAQAVETTLTVAQRGVQPAQPATVKLTGRTLYLPVVLR